MRVSTVLTACLLIVIGSAAFAQEDQGHITIDNPGKLSDQDIASVYQRMAARMRDGYGLSQFGFARNYTKWKRYNRLPYLSATHGNRYVNNFANAKSSVYGKLKPGEVFAAGTIFAKDSFTVTKKGNVFAGALFVMEKLAPGQSPATADWRYVMVMPDGSLFGDTAGDTKAQIAYCHDCHRQKASQDFVFFVPPAFHTTGEGD